MMCLIRAVKASNTVHGIDSSSDGDSPSCRPPWVTCDGHRVQQWPAAHAQSSTDSGRAANIEAQRRDCAAKLCRTESSAIPVRRPVPAELKSFASPHLAADGWRLRRLLDRSFCSIATRTPDANLCCRRHCHNGSFCQSAGQPA